jgi:hypothetical protein
VRPNPGLHGFCGLGHLPGLDANDNQIDVTDRGRIIGGVDRLNHECIVDAVDLQPAGLHGPQVIGTGDKYDLFSGLRQTAAEVPADRSGSEYGYTHVFFL